MTTRPHARQALSAQPIAMLVISLLGLTITSSAATEMTVPNCSTSAARDQQEHRPNVVIIYADDLGYGDVQCYNPQRGKIRTPNIDRLATQGMSFTDAHSSSGVCSPSRYTLLTGRYHWRTRLQSGIVNLWGQPLIANNRVTIATLAKQHGYRTACIGKWHLGWNWPIPDGKRALFAHQPEGDELPSDEQRELWAEVFKQPISGGPIDCGFDQYFGTDVPNWPPFCFIENDRTVGIPYRFLPTNLLGNNQASQQGPALERWSLEPILPTIGQRAIDFIQQNAQAEQPFLLYLPLTSPHTPLAVNDEWKDKSGLNRYADFVMETDAIIGKVLQAIKTAGIQDETLVLFTSDNGCAPYIDVEGLEKQGHFPSGPLRGYKADAWEGGHRIPFIVRWPGVVAPGSECHWLVHQADLLATFAEIFDSELPPDAGEDSFSLLPLLRGKNVPVRDTSVSCSIRGIPSLRVEHWKYIAAPGSGGWSKGGDQSQPLQLYDLSTDLAEATNLANSMPEKVVEMQHRLESIIGNGRSTPGPPQSNDVKVKRYPVK